jgi:peptidoglycan/LPS O-acetylase OafA/YrhL
MPSHARLPHVDGLRAIAVTLVVLGHAKVPGFDAGFVGVDMFFVISGFLIVGLLARELEERGRLDWWAFYARRVRRLVPAALLMLVVVVIASTWLVPAPDDRVVLTHSAMAAAVFGSNIWFSAVNPTDYFSDENGGTQALLHTWSLSVEEQFYLAIPLMVVLAMFAARRVHVSRRTALAVAIGLLSATSLAAAVWLSSRHPTIAYYSPVTRAYEFGSGGLAALLLPHGLRAPRVVRAWVGLAGVAGLTLFRLQPQVTTGFPSYHAVLPALATVALLLVEPSSVATTPVGRVLATRVPASVGRVSYGWYLWHWPFITLFAAHNLGSVSTRLAVVLCLAALVVAYLSERFVERRFRIPRGVAPASTPAISPNGPVTHTSPVTRAHLPVRAVLTGVGATVVFVGLAAAAIPAQVALATSGSYSTLAQQQHDRPVTPPSCGSANEERVGDGSRRCELVAFRANRPTLVLWGDSHAWASIPGLVAAAKGHDINVISWVAAACPPFRVQPGGIPKAPGDPAAQTRVNECVKHNDLAWADITKLEQGDQPVRLILGARWPIYLGEAPLSIDDREAPGGDALRRSVVKALWTELSQGLPDVMEQASATRTGVDFLAPMPEMPHRVPACLRRGKGSRCDQAVAAQRAYDRSANAYLASLRSRSNDSLLIDFAPALCDEKVCHARTGNVVNYFDDDHFSATRSRRLQRFFAPSIARLEGS